MIRALVALTAALWTHGLPWHETTQDWRPLLERFDPALQIRLIHRLQANPEWQRLIEQQKLAVCLVDLSGEVPRFARLNGHHMMYAASLPKIAILLTAYEAFEDGSLEETSELHLALKDMIQVSSNSAANVVIDAVGMDKIAEVMRDPRFGFYDEQRVGGLWVGKHYASTGPRLGDPLFNLSHGATVAQICRFYDLLVHGRLINAERSAQILADLADPGLHHKFVFAVEGRAPGARLFRKSGTWQRWHADSILVRGPAWRNYILAALVEDPNGETILRELLPAAEDVLEQTAPWQVRALDEAAREALFQERLPEPGQFASTRSGFRKTISRGSRRRASRARGARRRIDRLSRRGARHTSDSF